MVHQMERPLAHILCDKMRHLEESGTNNILKRALLWSSLEENLLIVKYLLPYILSLIKLYRHNRWVASGSSRLLCKCVCMFQHSSTSNCCAFHQKQKVWPFCVIPASENHGLQISPLGNYSCYLLVRMPFTLICIYLAFCSAFCYYVF